MNDECEYCSFSLAGQLFGVDVKHVQEVMRPHPMTLVPLAPPVVRGLINLRGQIVTALDLRRRLEFPERPDGKEPLNVVVRTDDGAVSLLVDEIGDVIRVLDDSLEPPPETLKGAPGELIRSVHKLESRLLLILDIERIIDLGTARP